MFFLPGECESDGLSSTSEAGLWRAVAGHSYAFELDNKSLEILEEYFFYGFTDFSSIFSLEEGVLHFPQEMFLSFFLHKKNVTVFCEDLIS